MLGALIRQREGSEKLPVILYVQCRNSRINHIGVKVLRKLGQEHLLRQDGDMKRSRDRQAVVRHSLGQHTEMCRVGEAQKLGEGEQKNQTGNRLLLRVCRSMPEPSPDLK